MFTSTDSTFTYQIEPLHSIANYNIWHIKIRYILINLGLFKYIKSMAPPLADSKSNESAIKIWNKKDHKVLSTISLCIDNSALVYIADAKISKEAWNTLKRMYEATGTISIIATC